MEFFRHFYRDLIQILTEPVRFYRDRFPKMTFTQALAFGILVNWIAAVLEWMTRIVKHETLWDSVKRLQEQVSTLPVWKNIPDTIWNQAGGDASPASSSFALEIGALIISPFQSLAAFCVSGLVLFFGAMILVPKGSRSDRDPLDLSLLIRLASVSAAPVLVGSILGFLPLGFGGAIGWIYHIAILVIGIALRFGISHMRAVGIVFLPGISLMLVFACIFGIFAVFLARLSGMS